MSKEIPKEIPPELYEVYDDPVREMRLLLHKMQAARDTSRRS